MSLAQRLQNEQKSKQNEWEAVHNRLDSLRQARGSETDPENKLKYEKRIKEVTQELEAIDDELIHLEQQLSQLEGEEDKIAASSNSSLKNQEDKTTAPSNSPSSIQGQYKHDQSKIPLIGKSHNAHLDWLSNTWISSNGSPVCFLEGFSGTGKSKIARELRDRMKALQRTVVFIEAPETERNPTNDFLENLTTELNREERPDLAKKIENNRSLLDVLKTVVKEPILIIIDEFQYLMQATEARGFVKTVFKLAEDTSLKGRILLLTNLFVEDGEYAKRRLEGMSLDDGVELLEYFARRGGQLDKIAPERRPDIVKWLGGNPRAMTLLVKSLAYDSLDTLIALQPELWEAKDQEVSPELIEELEGEILKKALNQLPEKFTLCLYRLAVHRKSFKKKRAIENLFPNDLPELSKFVKECINRFLMEDDGKNWYKLHPIAREIGLQKLEQIPNALQKAHSIAAKHYTRHFTCEDIADDGKLGGHFVEARYHLVKAGQEDELEIIANPFRKHIFDKLRESRQIPSSAEELDEDIATLAALLDNRTEASYLHSHLARLFQERNQRNDPGRALYHARKARSDNNGASWLLCSELLDGMGQADDAIDELMRGICRVPPESNLADLYNRCSRLLAKRDKGKDAVNLLQQGIKKIPPDKNLASLYIACGDLLTALDRQDDAVKLLQEGTERIPKDKSLADLFHKLSSLLVDMKKSDLALAVLERGIKRIPADKSLVILYESYSEILADSGEPDRAIRALRHGIKRIPPDKSLTTLYRSCGDLLAQTGKISEAIDILKEGINLIRPDKCLFPLYSRCGELMFQIGRRKDAFSLLRQGISRIPPEQGASVVYYTLAKLLVLSHKLSEAIETLLKGIAKIPTQYNPHSLVEFVLLLYVADRDERGITQFLQKNKGLQPQHIALANTLLQQLQEQWESAATYTKDLRKSGLRSPLLATLEAFSWLSAGQPERALDAMFVNLREEKYYDQWLNAFIQLRLGNVEETQQILVTFVSQSEYLSQDEMNEEIDETTLLRLWDQPSTTSEIYDLAYYFPTLPPALTGLPYAVTRCVYHPSVLPAHIKSKTSRLSRPTQKQADKGFPIAIEEMYPQENYVDFDLHIEADGHVIASSLEGEAEAYIPIQQPSNVRLSLKLIEQRQTDVDLLKDIGCSLYDWLFPSPIHAHLQQTEAVARRNQSKLRLRLRIESSIIASLPLEFIYRATSGYFFSTNPDTVFSRYLNLPLPPERVRRRTTPLHMLAIIADPTDQARLDPNEWETILKESLDTQLNASRMTLQMVKRATRKDIRKALLAQKPDIIQFVGHGTYQNGKGYLALVDEETDKTWLVDDERFADIFNGYEDYLGLISMATCESTQSLDSQGFLGIAPQLVQRGVPAVVAMQYKVYVKTAKIFLEDFYTCVAAHKPIDWAVQSARNAISLKFGFDSREFATPILYMCAKDGNVF